MIYPRVLIAASDLRQGKLLKNTLEPLGFEVRITSYAAAASAGDWKAQIIAVHIPRQIYEIPNSIFDLFSGVRQVPLIALLSEDNPEIEIKCLSAGADDCLPASSDYRVLGAHMQALIRRYGLARRVRRQKPLRAGPVVLDPARWTAKSGGRPVKLTPKEFAVLELLMYRKGGIVPRSALMDRIRRSFEESSSHTLETHISNLRSKLGRSCSCLIKSVAGVGYILSAGHARKRKTKR